MKLALVLPLLLSGCMLLGPAPTETVHGYTAEMLEAEFQQATAAVFTLADFEGDVLGLEIVTGVNAFVQVVATLDLTAQQGYGANGQSADDGTPRPCMSTYSVEYRSQLIGMLQSPGVRLSAGGEDASVRMDTFDTTMDNRIDFTASSYASGLSTPVVIALDGAEQWHARGSDLEVTLEAQQPFWYRLRSAGDLACQLLVNEGQGGTTADLGSLVIARDEAFPFTVDASNMVAAFIASDGGHSATLSSVGEVLYEAESDAGSLAWHYASGSLAAGDHRWDVHELQGSNDPLVWATGAALVVHELEDWVVVAPWLSGSDEQT